MSNSIQELKEKHSEAIYRHYFPHWAGNGKNVRCFAHDDENPSLSIFLSNEGDYRHYCHACGISGDVLDLILQLEGISEIADRLNRLKDIAGINETSKRIVKAYDYVDTAGRLIFQVVRYEPKDFRQRRPDGKGGWIWNLQGVNLVPYNLPDVVRSDYCILCEGERDVDTLKELGFVASCNPMGAGKWRSEYNEYFKGKRVYIIPDNDKVGREHAIQVARSLKGVASTVKIIELQGLPEKGDVTDWINQRRAEGKTDADTKEELEGLIKATPEWKAPEEKSLSFLKKGSELSQLDITIEWVIDGLLPKQSITLLHGKGGIGKTWLSLIMADAISKGNHFMGLTTQKMPVVFIDFENSLPVLVDRVKKIGIEDVLFWHNANGTLKPPKLDNKDWELYKQLPAGSLLIFDTLRASQDKDENDSQDMQLIMSRLKELRDMGFTILLLHHTPKGNEKIYKGSTAILDLADHVLSLHRVKKTNLEAEVEDDEITDCLYRLGTKDKTRYEPFHIFLEFDPEKGFIVAPDPDTETMKDLHNLIIELKNSVGELPIQSQIIRKAKEELDLSSLRTIKLLKKGEGKYWNSTQIPERKNARVYEPFSVFQFFSDIYSQKTKKLPSPVNQFFNGDPVVNTSQSLDNAEFYSFSESVQKTEKQGLIDLSSDETVYIDTEDF